MQCRHVDWLRQGRVVGMVWCAECRHIDWLRQGKVVGMFWSAVSAYRLAEIGESGKNVLVCNVGIQTG